MSAILALITMLSLQVDGSAGPSPVDELVQRITREMDEVNQALREAADADAVTDELDAARNSHLSVIRDRPAPSARTASSTAPPYCKLR